MTDQLTPYTIIAPTSYGTMLINRYDINQTNALLTTGFGADHGEIEIISRLFDIIDDGDPKIFVDIGANIGTHTLGIAKKLGGRGKVYSFEPQRLLFQMICGSLALNSYGNVHCHNVALSDERGWLDVPHFDYYRPMNFGSIEFGSQQKEPLHQERGTGRGAPEKVRQERLDAFDLEEAHIIKIDVEGMEAHVLRGATETIKRCNPIILIEYIKSDKQEIAELLWDLSYRVYEAHPNFLCIPDALSEIVKIDGVEFQPRRHPAL